MLLNLEHQVRFGELPWIAALQPFRADSADTAGAARQALAEVTFLAVSRVPADDPAEPADQRDGARWRPRPAWRCR